MSATVAMKVPSLTVDRTLIERLVRSALQKHAGSSPAPVAVEQGKPRIVANISARHVHLTPAHVE
jgi:putative phosphotransacetylase